MESLDYTYQMDKVSCVREFYFLHVTMAYLVMLSGVMCFVCRAVAWLRPYHALFGRAYILCMLWCMATSLLIHNTGLPIAVLISFVWVLGGLTVAWIIIKMHQASLEKEVLQWVGSRSYNDLGTAIHEARASLSSREDRTLYQVMFSYKAFHGMLMFMSFVNILGRIMASDQSGDFVCYTKPVYKDLNSSKHQEGSSLSIPEHDPEYARLPWASMGLGGWGSVLSLGPLAIGFGIGCAWYYAFYRAEPKGSIGSRMFVLLEATSKEEEYDGLMSRRGSARMIYE